MRHPLFSLTLVLLVLVGTSIAFAAPPAPAGDPLQQRAAELKQQGDAAMDALRYDDAIAAYTQAYAVWPDPALLYNRGRVHQARGEWPAALADLERFAHDASPDLQQRVPKLDELLAEVRNHVASLQLTANVPGARVLVRNVQVGKTPLAGPLPLDAGPAHIEVLAEGYFEWRKDVDLKGGASVVLDAQLAPRSTSGILRVRSTTAASRIRIDDAPYTGAPAEAVLPAGSHRVLVRADGFDDKETTVVVTAGETRDLDIEPEARPPLTSKWWFWTGLAVVVAAGAVTTYALVNERKADTGDHFQPGQVSGPLTSW